MRSLLLLVFSVSFGGNAVAQAAGSRDSAVVAELEQRIENAIVMRQLALLDSAYAPEFRFKHSTGELETRAEWLSSVESARFALRQVDSLEVEVHGDVALVTGRIHVRRHPDDPAWASYPEWREYTVRYVRLYAKHRGIWRLLTHHSTGATSGAPSASPSDGSPAG